MSAPLPEGLKPWSEELDAFDPQLAVTLGPWVARLANWLGPLSRSRVNPLGEPDGYGGLHRRGSYERLLATEWLLAAELPLEFERRAAEGEHLFFQLQRVEPAGSARVTLLLDAGPDQLGGPRLAQLALLVVLVRRAREQGAELFWGTVQDRPGRLREVGTDVGSLRETVALWLESRTALEFKPAEGEAWFDALDPNQQELWVLGSPKLTSSAPIRAFAVEIVDVVEPGTRALRLEIVGADRPAVRLELPSPKLCKRAFRDPFPRESAPKARSLGGLDSRVLPWCRFANKTRILAMHDDGVLAAYHVPNSPRDLQGKPRRLNPSKGEIVCVGLQRKDPLAVSIRDDELFVFPGMVDRPHRPPAGEVFTPPAGPAEMGFVGTVATAGVRRALFTDSAGLLFEAQPLREELSVVLRNVVAAHSYPHSIHFLYNVDNDGRSLPFHGHWSTGSERLFKSAFAPGIAISPLVKGFFGWSVSNLPARPQLLKAGTGDHAGRLWTIEWTQVRTEDVPAGFECVGVIGPVWGNAEPSLILLSEDRRSFHLLSAGRLTTIVAARGEVAHATANTWAPDLAYVTTDGQFVIYSLRWRAEVFWWLGRGA